MESKSYFNQKKESTSLSYSLLAKFSIHLPSLITLQDQLKQCDRYIDSLTAIKGTLESAVFEKDYKPNLSFDPVKIVDESRLYWINYKDEIKKFIDKYH